MIELPPDLILIILSYCSIKDKCKVRQLSKYWFHESTSAYGDHLLFKTHTQCKRFPSFQTLVKEQFIFKLRNSLLVATPRAPVAYSGNTVLGYLDPTSLHTTNYISNHIIQSDRYAKVNDPLTMSQIGTRDVDFPFYESYNSKYAVHAMVDQWNVHEGSGGSLVVFEYTEHGPSKVCELPFNTSFDGIFYYDQLYVSRWANGQLVVECWQIQVEVYLVWKIEFDIRNNPMDCKITCSAKYVLLSFGQNVYVIGREKGNLINIAQTVENLNSISAYDDVVVVAAGSVEDEDGSWSPARLILYDVDLHLIEERQDSNPLVVELRAHVHNPRLKLIGKALCVYYSFWTVSVMKDTAILVDLEQMSASTTDVYNKFFKGQPYHVLVLGRDGSAFPAFESLVFNGGDQLVSGIFYSFSMGDGLHTKNTVYQPEDYKQIQWKNGLGDTTEILIHPPGVEFETGDYVWRLARNELALPCNFAVHAQYETAVVMLPKNAQTGCFLHHHDQAMPVALEMLEPYVYESNWPTSCKFEEPKSLLMFSSNKTKTKVTVNVETICKMEEINPFDNLAESDIYPTNTMLLETITVLYVISGAIKVNLNNTHHILSADMSMIIDKGNVKAPTDLTMTPLTRKKDVQSFSNSSLNLDEPAEGSFGDAIVFIAQVSMLPDATPNIQSPLIYPSDPIPTGPIKLRGKQGSIIMFDDQPGWAMPPPKQVSRADSIGKLKNTTRPETVNSTTKRFGSARHYNPQDFLDRTFNESDVPPPLIKDNLDIDDYPKGAISTAWINMVKEGLSTWIRIPVIIARGVEEGPILGMTAVVHGNELNGVPCIHKVIEDLDVSLLKGCVVAVPCVNVPGYLRFSREFSDGKDLNRNFPGSPEGTASQVYNYNLFTKIIKKFNYMIDLHTASFGRINSYYVRADLNDPISGVFAKLQQPQIILHNSGQDGTMRSAAAALGIKSITVEIGNPQLFQSQFIQWSFGGVMRILTHLDMYKANLSDLNTGSTILSIVCSKGFWIYTKTGGVLEVYPPVNTIIRKGDLIARIKNIFGNVVDEIFSPSTGISIGKSSNPVAMAGDRVLHLGIIKKENEVLAAEAKENY